MATASPPRRKASALRILAAVALGGVVLAGAAELALRLAGVVDTPVFRVDREIGYYPAPNQHGAFLNKRRWAFDDQSLGVAQPYRWSSDGVLLVGDSVVYGGNHLDQGDKVGPLLARATGRPVWPLAAGGWALENEIKMLEARPDLLKLPTLVWISNSGDFGAENAWPNDVVYPDHHPRSALVTLLRRTVLKPHDVVDSPPSPQAEARWRADLTHLLARYHGRLIWVLYPKKAEVGTRPAAFAPLLGTITGRAEVVDVGASPAWRAATYADAIHPTPSSDAILANVIASHL